MLCLKYRNSFSVPLKTAPLVLIYLDSHDQQTWRHILTAFDGSCQKADPSCVVQDILVRPLQFLQQFFYRQSSEIPRLNFLPCCFFIFHSFFLQVYLVDTILEIIRKQGISGKCFDMAKFQAKNEADSMRESTKFYTQMYRTTYSAGERNSLNKKRSQTKATRKDSVKSSKELNRAFD